MSSGGAALICGARSDAVVACMSRMLAMSCCRSGKLASGSWSVAGGWAGVVGGAADAAWEGWTAAAAVGGTAVG